MAAVRRPTAALVAVSLVWTVLAWGLAAPSARATTTPTPTAPAAAARAPHDPSTYYAGTDGLSGATLAARLHAIIKGHTKLSYAQVYDALPLTDVDPARPGYLIDFYSGTSILASNRCGSSCGGGAWNREHTWPQSHGGLGTSPGPGTDLHHMRPEFGTTNSSRGNKDFDDGGAASVPMCSLCKADGDSFEPRDATKGDLARGVLYMAVRYEGDGGELSLKMNDYTCNESGPGNLGKLSTLIAWSLADPPDDRERTRNDLVDGSYQGNRNPFVDHPEWVTSVFGNGVGQGPQCGSTSGTDYVPGGTGPTNTAPTTSPQTATTQEDTATTVSLTASDADADPLTWTISQAPTSGTASITGSALTYTPAADAHGTFPVGVTVSDGRGTATTTVTITVTPVNDAPVAQNLAATTPRGTSSQVTLAATDVDHAAGSLTYAILAQPAHGTLAVSGTTVTYTPAADYTGPDAFTYAATDPAGATSAPATVSITVTTVQQPPTASDTPVVTDEDTTVTFPLVGSGPEGATLTYAKVTEPGRGRVTLSGGVATYVPRQDLYGDDTFTFTVSDGTRTSAPATARITVRSVNDPPLAPAVTVSTPEDTPVTVTLRATDAEGDRLTYALGALPAHGTVSLAGTTATYTPAPDTHGSDAFTWTVSDGTDTTTSSVGVTVTPVDDAPTVAPVSAATTTGTPITLPLAGRDVDGDALTYAATAGGHGTVSVEGLTATYTPEAGYRGTDTFTYTASDGRLTSPAATVTVRVTPRAVVLSFFVPSPTRGSTVRTTMTVTPVDDDGTAPTGLVTLRAGGRTVATAPLRPDGTATLPWTPTRAGSTTIQASYAGDDRFDTDTTDVGTVTVGRSASRLGFTSTTLRRGRAGLLKVSVATVSGLAATGRVTLTVSGRRVTASLAKGVATFRIAKLPQASRLAVTATYAGDAQYLPRAGKHTYAIDR